MSVQGQSAKISGNISSYIGEVDLLLKNQDTDKADLQRVKFPVFWDSYGISEQHRLKIVMQSKLIRKKKWKAYPYITNVIKLTALSVKYGMSSKNIDTLQLCIDGLLKDNNRRNVDNFFRDAIMLLEDSSLYSNTNLRFGIIGKKIKFKYYDPKAMVEPVSEEEPAVESNTENANETFNEWDEKEEDIDDWGSTDDDWGNSDEWGSDDAEIIDEQPTSANEDVNETVLELGYVAPQQPVRKGAVIEFKNVDLTISTKYDTVTIEGSTGFFDSNSKKIVADGGTVNWTNAGLGDSVFVELKAYNFRVDKAAIMAEGATIHYSPKLKEPVEGIFTFQSKKHKDKEDAEYPRFMSYNSNIEITDLGEDIKYYGGFSLNGQKTYSTSLSGGRCKIEVYKGDTLKFRTQAKHFILGDSVITGRPASIVIYQGQDSIYHPGVRFKFDKRTQELKVFKDKSTFKYAPFTDSYHQLNIFLDALFWNLNDSLINMTIFNAKQETFAYFESMHSFELKEYIQLKGLYYFHPIQLIVDYSARNTTKSFYTSDVAKYYKLKEKTIRSAMDAMMKRGYIDYNPKSHQIVMKEKAYHNVLSRRMSKDYDVIKVKSKNPGTYNATLDLSNDTLTIRGIDQVYLSDSLNVYFVPNDRTMKVGRNRSFVFDGVVETNNYTFTGRSFTFNYETFNISLVHIDSIQFSIVVTDSITGELTKQKLDNKLTYSAGTLTLDKANNKSGKNHNPLYPHFDANIGARILFNKKEILNGAYNTELYYQIPPFDVDSLSTSAEESVSFDGYFVSDSIFPTFDQKIGVMEDYSLGFKHQTPLAGYPLYETEGRFYGEISLDSRGLRGSGTIEYLNTTIGSGDFIFYQDSVVSLADNMYTRPGTNSTLSDTIKYPLVTVNQHLFKWVPRHDSMYVSNYVEQITVFTDSAEFIGTLSVGKYGLAGDGMLISNGAQTFSPMFLFKEHGFLSRHSQFEIVSDQPGKPALRSDRVKVDLDYTIGIATFNPEIKGVSHDEFPFLQYKTSIDHGTWLINDRIVTMKTKDTNDIPQSLFISTRLDQDSLKFHARKATYYMDSLFLFVEGVPYVNVADAKIIPNNEELYIRENAEMDSLHNARLLIDTLSEYHHLTDGIIKINGRQSFSGHADYAFINRNNDTLKIAFSKFELVERQISKKVKDVNTVSNGIIPENEKFHLAPYLQCKGTATMYSYKQILSIDGNLRFDLDSTHMIHPKYWLNYATKEDENDLLIPMKGQQARAGKPLIAGIYYNSGKRMFYPLFAEPLKSAKHERLMDADGFITYKDSLGIYTISSKERLRNENLHGNVISFNPDSNITYFNGRLNLLRVDESAATNIELDAAGFGTIDPLDSTTKIQALVNLKYELPSKLLDIMGEDIKKASRYLGTKNAVFFNDSLYQNAANLTDEKSSQKFKEKAEALFVALNQVHKNLSSGIVLNNLDLEYSRTQRAWYSKGPVAISNINDINVNSTLNGYLEIKKSKSGDAVNLYLELNDMTWYYFSFRNNALFTTSSNSTYNLYVDEKNTQAKNEPKGDYFYAPANPSRKKKFIRKFVTRYLGGKGFGNVEFDVTDNPDGATEEETIEDDFENFIDEDSNENIDLDEESQDTLSNNQQTNTDTTTSEVEEIPTTNENTSDNINEVPSDNSEAIEDNPNSDDSDENEIDDAQIIDDSETDQYDEDDEVGEYYDDEIDEDDSEEEVEVEEPIEEVIDKKKKSKKEKKKKSKKGENVELIEDEISE